MNGDGCGFQWVARLRGVVLPLELFVSAWRVACGRTGRACGGTRLSRDRDHRRVLARRRAAHACRRASERAAARHRFVLRRHAGRRRARSRSGPRCVRARVARAEPRGVRQSFGADFVAADGVAEGDLHADVADAVGAACGVCPFARDARLLRDSRAPVSGTRGRARCAGRVVSRDVRRARAARARAVAACAGRRAARRDSRGGRAAGRAYRRAGRRDDAPALVQGIAGRDDGDSRRDAGVGMRLCAGAECGTAFAFARADREAVFAGRDRGDMRDARCVRFRTRFAALRISGRDRA